MPSLQRRQNEALAAAVEPLLRPRLLVKLVGARPDPLEVRVERVGGSTIEFLLRDIVLDGDEMVGRDRAGGTVVIPLADVKAVWRRQLRADRSLVAWLSTSAAVVSGALALGSAAPLAAVVGAGVLLGLPFSVAVIVFGERLRLFSKCGLLYDRAD